ncbi:DHHC zinc finger domain-containing protein [Cryptosporidium muris RN66]|uniref:Palmitoyltransferase n=1 Tax=Cryptosporidium muris (strain RN66) TaxID=441375 RepID=B6AJE3_CRYMR|nr:DHHC zinc finger domain-containing protein [Cryptosporidium muris RN66]EEA08334.1 DHHC zinc finger domain-containing protein [Cryptosporidium muris RN66]|eukprot:XP_002142683.1 DHHC zinc finger domain-containing protein [Cryptosporidium muris RN66]
MASVDFSNNFPSRKRRSGICFLLLVTSIILFLYICYILILLQPLLDFVYIGAAVGISFHIVFMLFILSFYQCVTTDPGRVPSKWGFRVGDESKRRRYCKVCQVWKPDRTHHCSECARCVLNMDHHCPWINNCVGFYNRKFFIQLLIYAQFSLVFIFFQGTLFLIEQYVSFWPYNHEIDPTPLGRSIEAFKVFIVIAMLIITTPLLLALFPFSRLHIGFVVRNITTIESLSPQSPEYGRYDLGPERNIQQAFGYNPLHWFCPFNNRSSRPAGDGVRWPVRCPEIDIELGQFAAYKTTENTNHISLNTYHQQGQSFSPYGGSNSIYHQI